MYKINGVIIMKAVCFIAAVLTATSVQAQTYPTISGDTQYEHITRVQFGSIDNSTGADSSGYGDYTAQSTTISAGDSETITLTPGFASGSYNEGWAVWIDLNDDGDFDDTDEDVYTASPSSSAVSGTVTIPSGTASVTTRMRVVMKYNSIPSSSSGDLGDGEAEDYTIIIDGSDLPPAAPTGLAATPGDATVSLDWDNNTEGDLDSYTVYRSTTSGSGYNSIAADLTNSDYTDNSVTNGTTYYYVVTATDTASQESGYSTEVSATPDVDSTPPAAPTGLAATPGDAIVSLNWDDNTEGDLDSYTVYRSTTSGSGYSSIAADLTNSAYVDNTVTNGTTYYYVVTATDTSSNESGDSAEVSATPVDGGSGPSPIVYWALNETTGTTASDSSGNNTDGTLYGGLTFDSDSVSGPPGNDTALNFDGSDDYVGHSLTESTWSAYTVALWAKADALGQAEWKGLFNNNSSNPDFQLDVDGADPGSYRYLGTIGDALFGTVTTDWVHIAVTSDGSDTKLYYNGAYVTSISGSDAKFGQYEIGRNRGANKYFDGSIDEVRIYDVLLDDAQIANLYSGVNAPPAPPTGLAATPGDSTVSLDWNNNSEGDLDFYTVYRSTTSGSGYSSIATDLTNSDYVDNSVTNGTNYYYVVTATDTDSNESDNSAEVAAMPDDGTTPPAAPTGLAATPGNNTVSLDWDDNAELDLDTYTVYRSTSSGGGYSSIAASLTSSDHVDNTAVNGTTYYYVVTATDTDSNESAYSAEVSATPSDLPPAAPTGLAATPDDGFVNLDWNNNSEPDLDTYTVYRSTSSGGGYSSIAADLTNSDYTDNSVTNGTTYYYVVTATDTGSQESAYSAEVSATPGNQPPAPPTGLSATPGDTTVSLDWNNNSEGDLDFYTVYRSTSSGGGYSSIAASLTSSDHVDNSISNGTTYYYVVTATDTASNESGYSTEKAATPAPPSNADKTVEWKLEEAYTSGSDLMVDDTSGNNNDGTLQNTPGGGPTFTTGLVGNCLKLNGTDDSVLKQDASNVDLGDTDPWSMNLYVKQDRMAKDWTRIANLGDPQQRQVFIHRDGEIAFLYQAEGMLLSGKKMGVGTWHMITVTYDGADHLKLYVDGQEAASKTLPFSEPEKLDPEGNFLAYAHEGNFDGYIDEFTVWDDTLAPIDVQILANSLSLWGDTNNNGTLDAPDLHRLSIEWLTNTGQAMPELNFDDLEGYSPGGSDPNFAQRWTGSAASANTVTLITDPLQSYQGSQAVNWVYDLGVARDAAVYCFPDISTVDMRDYNQLHIWIKKHAGSTGTGRLYCKLLNDQSDGTTWDMAYVEYPGGLDALPDDQWVQWTLDPVLSHSWDDPSSDIPYDRVDQLIGVSIGIYSEIGGSGTIDLDYINLTRENGTLCRGALRPSMDMDSDCDVDLNDYLMFADRWLD